jgi:hypothetical protein
VAPYCGSTSYIPLVDNGELGFGICSAADDEVARSRIGKTHPRL